MVLFFPSQGTYTESRRRRAGGGKKGEGEAKRNATLPTRAPFAIHGLARVKNPSPTHGYSPHDRDQVETVLRAALLNLFTCYGEVLEIRAAFPDEFNVESALLPHRQREKLSFLLASIGRRPCTNARSA